MDNAVHYSYHPYGYMPGAWFPTLNPAEYSIVYDPTAGAYFYVSGQPYANGVVSGPPYPHSEGTDNEQVVPASATSVPQPGTPYEVPASWQLYTLAHVRDILRAAERWRHPHVRIILSSLAHSWSAQLNAVHVVVIPPGSSKQWLVLIFNRQSGLVFHGSETNHALRRAYNVMSTKAVPFSAIKLPCLSGKNGGVFATALAVWVSRNWRHNYEWDFVIDEKQARKEHQDILRGLWPDIRSVSIRRKAQLASALKAEGFLGE
ncbi:hypothetical protein A1Q2_02064 [Trichosporon asahii var. asahii CBS 8904]|uniref:Uncharacterized protein n=1 Tax=Trichosporon asahii var. asahii (strain CBS 8904) TaxID=1220162 RepID=K1VW09_TRIAC|nr:hypothetical protein A1Q2_02064 [Trichosporon asahii var. asahii CBS 8904]